MTGSFRFLLLAALPFLSAGTGCVSEVVQNDRLMPAAPPRENYRELTGYSVELAMASPRQITQLQDPAQVVFCLKNTGREVLRIDDWYASEAANIDVSCQPWLPGTDAPDDGLWIPLGAPVPANAARYPVELNPGNRLLMAKPLDFINKMTISPGAERRYFIRARLNLKSVKASTPVYSIVVKPPKPAKKSPAAL